MFNPSDETIGEKLLPGRWKPSEALNALALKRCSWVNCDEFNALQPPELWLHTLIVSCYYQGLADGVKHMAKKQRESQNG